MNEWFYMLRWALLLIGVVYFITEAGIFTSFRVAFVRALRVPRNKWVGIGLLYCPACIGFWVGVVLGALHQWPFDHGHISMLESGLAAMATAQTWSRLTGGNEAYGAEEVLIWDDDEIPPQAGEENEHAEG